MGHITDDVNLLGDNIYTIKRNTETLIDASKEAGLEINVEKTKYMLSRLSPECKSKSEHKNSKQIVLKMCHSSDICGRR
jgi:hypothetical protein